MIDPRKNEPHFSTYTRSMLENSIRQINRKKFSHLYDQCVAEIKKRQAAGKWHEANRIDLPLDEKDFLDYTKSWVAPPNLGQTPRKSQTVLSDLYELLVAFSMLALVILMAANETFKSSELRNLRNQGTQTSATVTKKLAGSRRGDYKYQYEFHADGKNYSGEFESNENNAYQHYVGQNIGVTYLAASPEIHQLSGALESYKFAYFILIFAAGVIITHLAIFFKMRRLFKIGFPTAGVVTQIESKRTRAGYQTIVSYDFMNDEGRKVSGSTRMGKNPQVKVGDTVTVLYLQKHSYSNCLYDSARSSITEGPTDKSTGS